MAYTDIRLLKLYNNKPPKPVLSLCTDDIRGMLAVTSGAKPHFTIRNMDPEGRDKYMNSTLKRVQSTSSIKPM